MKITAYFDSPDNADFAVGALKKALSPIASVDARTVYPGSHKISMDIFSSFNLSGTTPTYSMPVYNLNAYKDINQLRQKDYQKENHILEVVCQKEEAPVAHRIIIGYGGRNITKI